MKYLVKKLGLDGFMELVEKEKKALKNQSVAIDRDALPLSIPAPIENLASVDPVDADKYDRWFQTNVFEQKQKDFYGVQIRVHLGDIQAEEARQLAAIVQEFAADDIRVTVNQGFLIKFLRKETLVHVFNRLEALGLAEPGFDTINDVTACPGTDTCNLGVTNSTGLASAIENMLAEEYPDLVGETNIKIKICGCMNACGQHMAANIGFHGSSIKKNALVIPAMQVVIGGGVDPTGKGYIAEKVIKVPTKRILSVLQMLLDDYQENALEEEYFNDYYYRLGKKYFYTLLKPLASIEDLEGSELFDWGQDEAYQQAIGVGECAGVSYDMVGAIIGDALEKVALAEETLANGSFADSLYHSYSAYVIGAKALLLGIDVKCNTHKGILADFDTHYVETDKFVFVPNFSEHVLQINKKEASKTFAETFYQGAQQFVEKVIKTREHQLNGAADAKEVIANYYKA